MRDRRPYVAESRDLSNLAPAFKLRIDRVLADMQAKGHDAFVFEAVRTQERQWWIFGCGRTAAECTQHGVPAEYAFPEGTKVTNAASFVASVHGHGLACDIISKAKLWNVSAQFKADLAEAAKAHGLTWGGWWKSPVDWPHVQFPLLRNGHVFAGPSAADRERTAKQGMRATWLAYGAEVAGTNDDGNQTPRAA